MILWDFKKSHRKKQKEIEKVLDKVQQKCYNKYIIKKGKVQKMIKMNGKEIMTFKEWLFWYYGWTWEYFDNNISNPSHYYEMYVDDITESENVETEV